PGGDRWSRMMRDRADLGLITHLTLHELDQAGSVDLALPGQTVFVCENPQVLQAATHDRTEMPLLVTAVAILTDGKVADVDLGQAGDRLFTNLVSVGVSAQVAARAPHSLGVVIGDSFLPSTGRWFGGLLVRGGGTVAALVRALSRRPPRPRRPRRL